MQASTSGADNEARASMTEDESKRHFRVCRFIVETGKVTRQIVRFARMFFRVLSNDIFSY